MIFFFFFTGVDTLFAVKKQQQEVTPVLFGLAHVRRSIAEAEATVHGQIKGKATMSQYLATGAQ